MALQTLLMKGWTNLMMRHLVGMLALCVSA